MAIAASVVIANGAAHPAAAASGAVIASAALAAAATAIECVLVATNSPTYGAALATWIDLWACTATRAICHWAWTPIALDRDRQSFPAGRSCPAGIHLWESETQPTALQVTARRAGACRALDSGAQTRAASPRIIHGPFDSDPHKS